MENLGKADFFLVGEVAGSDGDAQRYRDVLGRNLDATLDIGQSLQMSWPWPTGPGPTGPPAAAKPEGDSRLGNRIRPSVPFLHRSLRCPGCSAADHKRTGTIMRRGFGPWTVLAPLVASVPRPPLATAPAAAAFCN